MFKILATFDRVIVSALILLMALVIVCATADLGWMILRSMLRPAVLLLSVDDLLDIFGAFLLVLVGIELLDTIRAYLSDHVVHAEVVFMAAMIALARKVITLDVKTMEGTTLIGIAMVILALSASYYLLKRSRTGI